ncbi:hypothetical protein ACLKA6_001546 [Drosophila palustris]
MPQSSPGRNRDEDPPNPHLVETVAKSSYDQRRLGTVTRIHLIFTWSRPWQRNRDEDPPNPHLVETVAKSSYDQRRVDTVMKICPPVETLISHLLKHSKLPRKAMT